MNEKRNQEVLAEIDLKEALFFLLGKWYLIVGAALILGAMGWAYSTYAITPMYSSTTSLYVINQREDSQQINYNDTVLASQFLQDYKELILTRNVLERAIQDTGAQISTKTLKNRMTVANKEGTRVINISVLDPNPEMAQSLANAIFEASAQQIKETIEVDAVKLVSDATLPTAPSSPNVSQWMLLGAFAGGALMVIILFILFISDNTIKTTEDVQKYLGWSTLALVPVIMKEENLKKDRYGAYYSSADKMKKTSTTSEPRKLTEEARKSPEEQ